MVKRSPDTGRPDGREAGAPPWRPILIGLAAASAVALTVVIALLLALQELPIGVQPSAPVVQPSVQFTPFTPFFTPVPVPTDTPVFIPPTATATNLPPPLAPTFTPALEVPATAPATAVPPTPLPSPTPLVATLPPLPQVCTPPYGWVAYTVQVGDTLDELAYRYRVDVLLLMQANCLNNPAVYPGQLIFLPPVIFTPTPLPPPPCGPPPGWVQYVVQPGDTLNSLAARTNTTPYAVAQASCLTHNVIRPGQVVWLPFLPPPLPMPSPTLPPTATYTPVFLPTPTLLPTPSHTPAATFTATSQPPTATHTPLPTATHIPTPLPTETATPTPRLTNTPVPFLTPTPGP
jgi:LysM repeat protein